MGGVAGQTAALREGKSLLDPRARGDEVAAGDGDDAEVSGELLGALPVVARTGFN